jgi:hypothetical protein
MNRAIAPSQFKTIYYSMPNTLLLTIDTSNLRLYQPGGAPLVDAHAKPWHYLTPARRNAPEPKCDSLGTFKLNS